MKLLQKFFWQQIHLPYTKVRFLLFAKNSRVATAFGTTYLGNEKEKNFSLLPKELFEAYKWKTEIKKLIFFSNFLVTICSD